MTSYSDATDSGASIHNFFTPEELKIIRALWPCFMEARARGQRAQFHRARLVPVVSSQSGSICLLSD